MKKTKKPQEKNLMTSVVKMFVQKDTPALAYTLGLTVSEFEGIRSELAKGELTPRERSRYSFGRVCALIELLSTMLDYLEGRSKPDPVSEQKDKTLYV